MSIQRYYIVGFVFVEISSRAGDRLKPFLASFLPLAFLAKHDPENEDSGTAFRNALHNLHGASGAYGGGALTRLTGSLHELVSGVEDLHQESALINLHVQACRATSFGEGADDVADAVCDALEYQVGIRLIA